MTTRDTLKLTMQDAGIPLVYGIKACRIAERVCSEQPALHESILLATNYLNTDASMFERLINIRLDIKSLPLCENCGSSLSGRIYQQREYHRFCTADCRHSFVTKARIANLMEPGENGITKAKLLSRKSVETQRGRIVDGINGIDRRIRDTLITKAKTGQISDPLDRTNLDIYISEVYKCTKRQPLKTLPNIEKRAPTEKGGWHLDHKYSVSRGFQENIPPYIIGNIANLEMLPGVDNVRKQSKCSIDIEELCSAVFAKL